MTAYYNEIDPFAAEWLRELIKAGHIAPGIVDERSIADVSAADLDGFTQCHFFAGIGVWSHALRLAGWQDDRPVWTGSCPCQSFSAAGKGAGFDDPRHLWPTFFNLIKECRPVAVFGEQVASAIKFGWLDLVQDDFEGINYAVGSVSFPACSVGAPHIRQRLYWAADSKHLGHNRQAKRVTTKQNSNEQNEWLSDRDSAAGGLGITDSAGSQPRSETCQTLGHRSPAFATSRINGVADSTKYGCSQSEKSQHVRRVEQQQGWAEKQDECKQSQTECCAKSRGLEWTRPMPTNGFWGDADWLYCRDGKWRPVEPGSKPLVDVVTSRVGRLRGYGNAIVAAQAEAFITAFMESSR